MTTADLLWGTISHSELSWYLFLKAFFGERRIEKKQSCDGFLQELFASWKHSKDVLSAAFTEGKKPNSNPLIKANVFRTLLKKTKKVLWMNFQY